MEGFESVFEHLSEHKIIRCRQCRYAVVPTQVKAHLAGHHKGLSTLERQDVAAAVDALPCLASKPEDVLYPGTRSTPIDGFPVLSNGIRCQGKRRDSVQCTFVCQTTDAVQKHCKREHSWTNTQKRGGDKRVQLKHTPNKMWKECVTYQQFFRVPKWKKCFEVAVTTEAVLRNYASETKAFFDSQTEVQEQFRADMGTAGDRVEGFDAHRSTVVPWLRETGIAEHLRGLGKQEIRTAIALPSDGDEDVLQVIVDELENVLRKARFLCSDGEDCMLTWPCRVTLSRFQSAQIEAIGSTRAFDPYKQEQTLRTYFRTAKQLLCYINRVAASEGVHFSKEHNDTQQPEDIIELTSEQLAQWHIVWRLAEKREGGEADDEAEDSTDGLGDEIVRLFMSLVCHRTGARRYSSPILSFCAMLALKLSTGSWMEPGNFNSHLSAIIWVVQLLIFYDSAQQERRGLGTTHSLVKKCCEEYLQQTVEAPMGEILRWRLLLFHVSRNTVSGREATWDESEQVLTYEGTELRLDQIPALLQSEYIECHRLLYDDLMLGDIGIPRMHATDLKDNESVETVGWNFTQHPENRAILAGADTALLNTIEQSDRLSHLFVEPSTTSSTGVQWRENAIASYEATVQQFLARLCSPWHIAGGQPLRESEFFSTTWRNTQRKRAISIGHRRVRVHTQYDKMQQKTGRYKENIRFLPQAIGDMLLDYIVYVQPLRQIFLRREKIDALLSSFLWEKGGAVWREGKLSQCLEEASTRARVPRLHVANWRQMTVAIVKTKFASDIGCFEQDDDDEDAEEINQDIRMMTQQRNHKTHTVNRAYANQAGASFGGVWDGLVRMGLRASTLWQDFWGVDIILKSPKRKQGTEGSRLAKRVAMGIFRPRRTWTSDELLVAMRTLHGRPDMEWRTPEQQQALTLITGGREQVVAVLPTGAGKSMLFLLPPSLPDAACTVLIVPLVALRGDLLRRIHEVGTDTLEWLPEERREASLIILSVEAAASPDFLRYAQQLIARQRLDRIVIDECHLTVTAVSYRPAMIDLTAIRVLRTQFVYLTATLPPSMWDEFVERNHLLQPTLVRASSNRSNISYMVRKAVNGRGSLAEQAASIARHAWEESGLFDHTRDKIILYTRTRDEAGALAKLLDCDSYTSQSGTTEEKQKALAKWVHSPNRPYIVATTALAEGFDYPHVRLVMNVNEPESLILFSQESGRAGRDGQKAFSVVLLPTKWEPQGDGEVQDQDGSRLIHDASLRKKHDRQAMRRYLRAEQCFRTSLSESLDTSPLRRWCMTGDVLCDVCGDCHVDPIPPSRSLEGTSRHTGLDVIQQQKLREHLELTGYRERLVAVKGGCLLCRVQEVRWDHAFATCARRSEVFGERNKARGRHERQGRVWLRPYTACFLCLNPQTICARALEEE